jgi:hypothetical protein
LRGEDKEEEEEGARKFFYAPQGVRKGSAKKKSCSLFFRRKVPGAKQSPAFKKILEDRRRSPKLFNIFGGKAAREDKQRLVSRWLLPNF